MVDEARLYGLLGERLRRLREEHRATGGRLTQAELAARVGLERTSITNIEKGAQKVPLHVLYRLCNVLGTPVSAVLPTLLEVDAQPDEKPVAEFELGGRTYQTTPKVQQAIAGLLTSIEERRD